MYTYLDMHIVLHPAPNEACTKYLEVTETPENLVHTFENST